MKVKGRKFKINGRERTRRDKKGKQEVITHKFWPNCQIALMANPVSV